MTNEDWTQRNPVVCPDCGYVFAHRSVTGTVQIVLRPGNPRGCKVPSEPSTVERVAHHTCPRVQEALDRA